MASKNKFYVVWEGREPGIYTSWKECEKQIKNFPKARFKGFESEEDAQKAFAGGYVPPVPKPQGATNTGTPKSILIPDENGIFTVAPGTPNPPELNSIAVDAACSGNPGVMEYRGVHVLSGQQLFHFKAELGTNNIGEFLALVHGLSYQKKYNMNLPLYSDSVNAINWVKKKQCRSKLVVNEKTQSLWDIVHRAEGWLVNNQYTTEIRKWETERWGEIPADFGRK